LYTLEYFGNDNYKVLKFLYDIQIPIENTEEKYIYLSQQEIANIIRFSKTKINAIMQDLKRKGFIDNYNKKRGKYIITDIGKQVIELMGKSR
jgi:hypothetical protein